MKELLQMMQENTVTELFEDIANFRFLFLGKFGEHFKKIIVCIQPNREIRVTLTSLS